MELLRRPSWLYGSGHFNLEAGLYLSMKTDRHLMGPQAFKRRGKLDGFLIDGKSLLQKGMGDHCARDGAEKLAFPAGERWNRQRNLFKLARQIFRGLQTLLDFYFPKPFFRLPFFDIGG